MRGQLRTLKLISPGGDFGGVRIYVEIACEEMGAYSNPSDFGQSRTQHTALSPAASPWLLDL